MKTLIASIILGFTSLAACAENVAGTTIAADAKENSLVAAPQNVRAMGADEFYKFVGSYDLANGHRLNLFTRTGMLYARVDDLAWHQIVAVGADTFVAKDRSMKFKIDIQENGDRHGELTMGATQESLAIN